MTKRKTRTTPTATPAEWLQPHRDKFLNGLSEQGYARHTLRTYDTTIARFCAAMAKGAIGTGGLDGRKIEGLRTAVLASVRPSVRVNTRFCLERFIASLAEAGVASLPKPPQKPTTALERLRTEYETYLREQRGLAETRRPIETTLRAMMTAPHLGPSGVHPVVASAARELLNKSDNERSGVLSTAMSFLGLYRDPVVARVTRQCDWRIRDLVEDPRPATLYLVVPPSDISRTKPLVRLILNQIGRRLTEELDSKRRRHRLLLMLDEFPALGRLDFFESALAFMAGYGLKSFLIAQSLNQIEKAYGQNNSILDNCHVRVSFATNDERTAKRVSDALGTATEMRAMKNYAGHRLSPWLGHLMVSRQETARPLLTPGEVMQLPSDDELILVSGCHPIRAKKARYFEDAELKARILPPPRQSPSEARARIEDSPSPVDADGWTVVPEKFPLASWASEMTAWAIVASTWDNGISLHCGHASSFKS